MQQLMAHVVAVVAMALILGLALGNLLTRVQIDPATRDRLLPVALQIGIMVLVMSGVAIALVLGLTLPARSTESPDLPRDTADREALEHQSDAAAESPAAAVPSPAEPLPQAAASDAPATGPGPARTGALPGAPPLGQSAALWRVDLGREVRSSPVVANGTVFIGAGGIEDRDAGALVALDAATGEERWRYEAGSIVAAPAVHDDQVFIGSLDGSLSVLDARDGRLIRRFALSEVPNCLTAAPPVLSGDTVLANVACLDPEDAGDTSPWTDLNLSGSLAAFDAASGAEVWRFATAGLDPGLSPALSDGMVIVSTDRAAGDASGTTYALDAVTGREVWRFQARPGFLGSPVVDKGLVFVAGRHGELFALDLGAGLERWRFDLGTEPSPPPAVSGGVIYAGAWAGSFSAIDAATGEALWHLPGFAARAPAVVSGEMLYVPDLGGNVHVIDRETGRSEVIHAQADGASPDRGAVPSLAVSDGVIYLTQQDGVVALALPRAPLAIAANTTVAIRGATTPLLAAPSTAAIVRAELAIGTALTVTGEAEEREGQTWWPVATDGEGIGWVPESAIIISGIAPAAISTTPPIASPALPSGTPAPLTDMSRPLVGTPSPTSEPGDALAPPYAPPVPRHSAESQAVTQREASAAAASETPADVYLAQVYTGTCGELGTPREQLADLVLRPSPGLDRPSLPLAVASTRVDRTLADMSGGGSLIGVTDPARPSALVACGEIAGTPVPDEQGDVFNALSPVSNSGAAGIAWLHDNGDATTSIVVFFALGVAPSGTAADGSPRPWILPAIVGRSCDAGWDPSLRLNDVAPPLPLDGSARSVGVSTTEIAFPIQQLAGRFVMGFAEQNMESPVVCGGVAGEPDVNGDLFLAVPAHGDSPAHGFAWLHDNRDGTTSVVLLVV